MIEDRKGDLFDSGASALVCPVNCKGVMGAGLAVAFRKRFPEESSQYIAWSKQGLLRPGEVFAAERHRERPFIFFAATKDEWRHPSQLMWVQSCAQNIRKTLELLKLESVAVPALGCGRGELVWSDVEPWVRAFFRTSTARFLIYAPL